MYCTDSRDGQISSGSEMRRLGLEVAEQNYSQGQVVYADLHKIINK